MNRRAYSATHCEHGRPFPSFGCPGCEQRWRENRASEASHIKGCIETLRAASCPTEDMEQLLRLREAALLAGPPTGVKL